MRSFELEGAIGQLLDEGYQIPPYFCFPVGAEDYIAFASNYRVYVNKEKIGQDSESLYTCVKLSNNLIAYRIGEIWSLQCGSNLTELIRCDLDVRLSVEVIKRLREILDNKKGL